MSGRSGVGAGARTGVVRGELVGAGVACGPPRRPWIRDARSTRRRGRCDQPRSSAQAYAACQEPDSCDLGDELILCRSRRLARLRLDDLRRCDLLRLGSRHGLGLVGGSLRGGGLRGRFGGCRRCCGGRGGGDDHRFGTGRCARRIGQREPRSSSRRRRRRRHSPRRWPCHRAPDAFDPPRDSSGSGHEECTSTIVTDLAPGGGRMRMRLFSCGRAGMRHPGPSACDHTDASLRRALRPRADRSRARRSRTAPSGRASRGRTGRGPSASRSPTRHRRDDPPAGCRADPRRA